MTDNTTDICTGCGNHWKQCTCQNTIGREKAEATYVACDYGATEAARGLRILQQRRAIGKFTRLRDLIRQQYELVNGKPCPWTIIEGHQLKGALARLANWKLEELENCVRNRFASDKNHAEPPHRWLAQM